MKVKLQFLGIIFLLLCTKSYSQIHGDAEICRNSNLDNYYYISNYDDTKEVNWDPTGEVTYTEMGATVSVRWGTNSPTLRLKVSYTNTAGISTAEYLEPTYREVGVLRDVTYYGLQQDYYCAGDTIVLQANATGTLENDPTHMWYIYDLFESKLIDYIETEGDTLNYIVPDDVGDTELRVAVKAGNSYCKIYTNTVDEDNIEIRNCGFKYITFDAVDQLARTSTSVQKQMAIESITNKLCFYKSQLARTSTSV